MSKKKKAYFTDQRVMNSPKQDRETVERLRRQEEQTYPRNPARARLRTGNRT